MNLWAGRSVPGTATPSRGGRKSGGVDLEGEAERAREKLRSVNRARSQIAERRASGDDGRLGRSGLCDPESLCGGTEVVVRCRKEPEPV